MSRTADVLIIGGGVIGCALAYELGKSGVSTIVVDKGPIGREASWASAGILSHGDPSSRRPYACLATASRSVFPQLCEELRERSGVDPEYRPSGGLHLFQDESQMESGRLAALDSQRRGIDAKLILRDELQSREPLLSPDLAGALEFLGDGSVRNPRFVRALMLAAQRTGAYFHPFARVVGFKREGTRIVAAFSGTQTFRAGQYVIASGAWSGRLGQMAGQKLDVFPSRGQIVLLESLSPPLNHVVHEGDFYLVPRSDGKVIVGATVEEAGFDKSTTTSGIRQLLRWALSVAPGLRGARFVSCWSGLRPGVAGRGPLLGRSSGSDNLFVATGHNRNGILLSAITGIVMKNLLVGEPPQVPVESFSPP